MCVSMPTILMHAGAGVLLIIMTNFTSHKANNKEQNHKSQITNHKTKSNKPPPSSYHHIPNINTTKSAPKTNITTKRPAPYNKLTAEMQFFQMRKMDQT